LSYNNEGIMDFEKIKELLTGLGKVILYQKVYKKFKSNIVIDDDNVYEYLFHLDKLEKTEFIQIKIDQ
jgi:adenine-specific DNA methylase